ncbi:hypothetical protein ElyMa_006437100 [Elysia marginata]|uniref:Uncharacterized protein n=1 Tax=Elysia marginata TaxID=1093978 RepID=A0AAV4HXX8_9GAST|nr:hypothetical protein ElyMa_006437100 [Elysia marginata]
MQSASSPQTIHCKNVREGIEQIDLEQDRDKEFYLDTGSRRLSVKGLPASEEGRIVRDLDKTPQKCSHKISIYHDTLHTFTHLEDGKGRSMTIGKYPRNKGIFRIASKLQQFAFGLPFPLNYAIGLPFIATAKIIITCDLCHPVDAFLNDEERLYEQSGQDWRHRPHVTFEIQENPHVTFEIQEKDVKDLFDWASDMRQRSIAGENPFKFQILVNDCHGFTRELFEKTGLPGQFNHYFDRDTLHRSIVSAEHDWMSDSFYEGLKRLNNIYNPWAGGTQTATYKTPNLSDSYIQDLIDRANNAIEGCTENALKVSKPKQRGCLESCRAYLSSASAFTQIHRLQSEGRYEEALKLLNKIFNKQKKEFAENSAKKSIDDGWRDTIAHDLRLIAANANKIAFKVDKKLK